MAAGQLPVYLFLEVILTATVSCENDRPELLACLLHKVLAEVGELGSVGVETEQLVVQPQGLLAHNRKRIHKAAALFNIPPEESTQKSFTAVIEDIEDIFVNSVGD